MSVIATDNFTRANNADLGANWTPQTGNGSFQILSNTAQPASLAADSGETYTGAVWPNDQYSLAVINALSGTPGVDRGIAVGVRMQTGSYGLYSFMAEGSGANPDCSLQKIIASAFTQLGTADGNFIAGDTLYVEIQGTTIKCRKGSGGSDLITSTGDAQWSTGNAGINYSSTMTTAALTSWEGGDFAAGGGGGVSEANRVPDESAPAESWNNWKDKYGSWPRY